MRRLTNISFGKIAVCAVYAWMLLILLAKQCVLQKGYSLSMWPLMTYYLSMGLRPGVLLPVLGSMLTAFCKFPVIGPVLVLCSLAALSAATSKLSGNTILTHLPALGIFLFISGMDYSIYLMRSPGIFFSQTIGLALSILTVAGEQDVSGAKARYLYVALALLVGYPLIGAYALVALCGIMLRALLQGKWKYASFALGCGIVLPLAYNELIFTHIDLAYTFVSGFPYMDFLHNGVRFIPLAAAVAAVLAAAVLPSGGSLNGRWICSAFLAAALPGLLLLSYTDRNFHLELRMEQELERNRWDNVLDLALRTKKPTRVIVMYRNIALMRSGRLCDRMFTYPHETVTLAAASDFVSQSMVSAMPVFFYNGLLNFSARWAFEESMIWQRSIESYKYLATAALFGGYDHPALVEKYLDVIEENPFERKWVAQYRRYLENPSLLEDNEDYRYARVLSDYEAMKFSSSAVVENTLTVHYLDQKHPHGVMLQLCLATAMMVKDIDAFWRYFDLLGEEGPVVPVHVGEAALLFASISGNQRMFDAAVHRLGGWQAPTVRRFASFEKDASAVRDAAVAKEYFQKQYGDTYWYYCYYVKNVTTD